MLSARVHSPQLACIAVEISYRDAQTTMGQEGHLILISHDAFPGEEVAYGRTYRAYATESIVRRATTRKITPLHQNNLAVRDAHATLSVGFFEKTDFMFFA